LFAETFVYQEFENEWKDSTDGVFSFPLPQNARATRLQYSVGDTLVDAVLKVQQQSTTPGTGEGGEIAELNKYMGSNVLKLGLKSIPPGGIKAIRLSYISTLKQFRGNYEYDYPLNTGTFVKHPLDYLKINVKVYSSGLINGYDLLSHPGFQIISAADSFIELNYLGSKEYAAKDIVFTYSTADGPFRMDLFSWKPDSTDGYFTLLGKPQMESADSTLSQAVIFLLGNSTTMTGNKLKQSKAAINLALDELSPDDYFNIIVYNSYVSVWESEPVAANIFNIKAAKSYVNEIGAQSGNRLDVGLRTALNQLKNSWSVSSILAFTDGKSPLYAQEIEELNSGKTGIFMVAFGNDIDRVRLESVTARNYGFVSYLNESDILATEMVNIFCRIKNPILRDIVYKFDNPAVYDVFPEKVPAIFAGTDFSVSGRFQTPGVADIQMEGESYSGNWQISFERDFDHTNELSRKLWAKLAIDHLEAQILIFGEADSLKNKLIELSLAHNIRCRYTAYVEDESFREDPGETTSYPHYPAEDVLVNTFYNYPNPFTDRTIIKFFIPESENSYSRIIEFYDANGRLIKTIDISLFEAGVHEIYLYRSDLGGMESGVIIARLLVDNIPRATFRMILMD
ncbi:MAG: VWA domain-containing protein, partial [Bacteroidales bacterium]|nr:VWA domain-containing protein [Bacteroidales bacterium]